MQSLLRSTQRRLCRRLGVASSPAFSAHPPPTTVSSSQSLLSSIADGFGHGYSRGIASSTTKANGKKKLRKCKKTKPPATILKNSSHRNGSIYKGTRGWKPEYWISNTAETRMKAMLMTDPEGCMPNRENCVVHKPCPMLHILSLKLAKISSNGGPVQLYGYLAVRDYLDPLRNYVFNRSRNDPIIVEKGSLIEMTSPKRGMAIGYPALIEYDMRIKSEGKQEDDQQLIDGVLSIHELRRKCCRRFTTRIDGVCGAIDMSVGFLPSAVEATVEVTISEVHSCFDLYISSYVSGLPEEFELFQGIIGEPCGLRRFVIPVLLNRWFHLRFAVLKRGSERYEEAAYSLTSQKYGYNTHGIYVGPASFSLRVTWSTLGP